MFLTGTKKMLGDRIFLQKAVRIALPVAMQGMLNTIVNLVDTMMIGTLGETTIAAVGLANKVFFVFSLLVFGIVSGSGVLAAQYWGNNDVKNIRKVLGLALMLALAGAAAFMIPAMVCPELVMRIFTVSPETIRVGSAYLVVAAVSYPFTAFTNVYVAMLRAVGQVKLPVFTSCLAIVVNIVLNFLLIFPARTVTAAGQEIFIYGAGLGVVGAALATLIARIVEAAVLVLVVYMRKFPIACRIREMFGYTKAFIRQFVSTCAPVIANEFMWGLGVTMYSLAYGRMGDNAVAAVTIAMTIQDIVFVLFQGLSAATAVILGNEMGAGHLERAEEYAANFLPAAVPSVGCRNGDCADDPGADPVHLPDLSGGEGGRGQMSPYIRPVPAGKDVQSDLYRRRFAERRRHKGCACSWIPAAFGALGFPWRFWAGLCSISRSMWSMEWSCWRRSISRRWDTGDTIRRSG